MTSKCGRLVLSVASGALGLGLAACGSGGHEVGATNTGQSAQASLLPTATVTVTATPTLPSQTVTASPGATEFNPPKDDVQLVGCVLTDDPYHSGSHSGKFVGVADLKITNHSSKVSDYIIEVEFVNTQGDRLDTGASIVSKLAPGQSVNNADEDAHGLKAIPADTKLTCRILDVTRVASTQ
ncbi:hypothetical protein ACGFZP_16065 [Kitasatospora sp. NPDC048239]|uniref:hypothetical protein n=1 Tax=Kitasatospora sp. NPDC048239 TaxID=3364046 RepID=UPI00371A8D0B